MNEPNDPKSGLDGCQKLWILWFTGLGLLAFASWIITGELPVPNPSCASRYEDNC